jgi:F-type H+-transporting ATPase subunit epsilon
VSLELTIVTPEGQAFHGEVESVVLPGAEGEFGVLAGHEPFLSALQTGGLELQTADGKKRLAAVSRGYAEIHGDKVNVMVGTCEWAGEIDTERAERARQRALKALEEARSTPDGEAQYQELREAYSRAVARITVSERFKS